MDLADIAIVFYNPEAVAHKKLPPIDPEVIYKAFGGKDLLVLNDSKLMESKLFEIGNANSVFLMMSSGNFNGIQLQDFSKKIVHLRPYKNQYNNSKIYKIVLLL